MIDRNTIILYFCSALIGIGGAIFVAITPLSLPLKVLAIPIFILGLLRLFQGVSLFHYLRQLKEMRLFSLSPSGFPYKNGEVYLGRGFRWDNRHAQQMYNLSRGDLEKYLAKNRELGGISVLHGIGAREEKDFFLPLSELVGHVALVGATRVGKTRGLEILLKQAIESGDPVIMIDPKGEERLLNFCYSQAISANREDDFMIFSPPYPQISKTYNPLENYASITDIADRVTALLPQGGDSQAFTNFCHSITLAVSEGMEMLGEVISLRDIERYALFQEHTGKLMVSCIKVFFKEKNISIAGLKDKTTTEHSIIPITEEQEYAGYYKQVVGKGYSNKTCEDLIRMYDHPRENFIKLSNQLGPLLSMLNAEEKSKLLSAIPSDIDWEQAVNKKKIVYFYLGSLLGLKTANSIAQITLQDLISYIGRRYVYSSSRSPIWLFIDEFHNVCYPGFVDLISKAGGAGLRVVLVMQSIADLEANMGYNAKAHAQQILDNTNTKIFMRVTDAYTAMKFTDKVGETTITEYSEMTSSTPEVDDSMEFFDTSYRKTKRDKEVPLVRPDWINALPKGQAFVYSQGKTYKVRFPLLSEPERNFFTEKGLK